MSGETALSGYGEERHHVAVDVLQTLHELLQNGGEEIAADHVAMTLDLFAGWIRTDLHALAIEACNAGYRS